MAATSYSAPVVRPHSRQPGRPRFHITREQLQYLASMSFSWTQIAQILGVSDDYLYRRRVEYGMLNYVSRNITDEELRVIVESNTQRSAHARRNHDVGSSQIYGIPYCERESSLCY